MKNILYIAIGLMCIHSQAQVDSLSLQKAISMSLLNNYAIVIQKKEVLIDSIGNTIGNAGALPTISFTGSTSKQWTSYVEDDVKTSSRSASVDLDWTVFNGFSAKIEKSRLEELEKQSKVNLSYQIENAIVNVTLAYYQSLLNKKEIELKNEVMDLSEDRFKIEKRKKDIGASNTYDLLQAQVSWLNDKSSFLEAKSEYNNSIRQLNYYMAEPLENTYLLSTLFEADTVAYDKKVLRDKMISNNNILKNQYINLQISRLSVRAAKSGYYPSVSLGASAGYAYANNDYIGFDENDDTSEGLYTALSASLSYEIYGGGKRKIALQTAKLEEEINEIETSEIIDDLTNQLAQEFELYELRKQLLYVADESLKAAKLNLDISLDKYKTGAINSFNYRDIQEEYQDTSISYYTALYNLISSRNTLMQLTGGFIEDMNDA